MIKDILSGTYDAQLNELSEAIKARREHLNTISFFDFKVGDKVKFNSLTRPQYLIGCEAIIKEKKQKKIVVNLVKPPVGSRFNNNISTSVSLVEKV
jgi:hypothetical protein